MNESKKTYKLDCDIPTGILIGESFTFLFHVLLTAGLGLPFALFHMAKVIIRHTEVTER
jgi:hypothetical protein